MFISTMSALISLIILFSLASLAAAVEHCRCESKGEDLYSRRRLTRVLQSDHGFHSVKIDRNGYYVVDKHRVLPPLECEQHRRSHAVNKGGVVEQLRGVFSYWASRLGVRGTSNDDLSRTFPCDSLTVNSPPHGSGLPETEEAFLLAELRKSKFVVNGESNLVREPPIEFNMLTRSDGTRYLAESELDCEKLPLSVQLNQKALSYHCRCPENVNPNMLPDECYDKHH